MMVICRELTEKHRALLELYDKESQINRRLSMDKEQLMWRLTQTDVSTFGPAEDFFHDSSNNEF